MDERDREETPQQPDERYREFDREPAWAHRLFERINHIDVHLESYHVLFERINHVDKQIHEIHTLCTAILEKLNEVPIDDTKPISAKINMEDTNMADISVPDTAAPLNALVAFSDVHGHPTSPQDVPQWSSSDPNVATVDASADPAGLAAVVTILGPGATVVGVSSTDTDGTVISAAGTITVTSGPPVTGEVMFSDSTQPVEPPVA